MVLVVVSPGGPESSLYLERGLAIGTSPVVRPVDELTVKDVQAASVVVVVVLNDVAPPSGERGVALSRFVEDGGGLWVVLGENARWAGGDFELLPGAVGEPADRDGGTCFLVFETARPMRSRGSRRRGERMVSMPGWLRARTSAVVCGLVVTMATSQPAFAQYGTIDMRNQSEPGDGDHRIHFCARSSPGKSGLPGHAFVAYSYIDAGNEHHYYALGSQPNGSNSLADLWGGGHLRAEVMTFDSQACYEVLVNKATYEVAWAHAKNPLTALGIVDQANAFAVLRSYRLGSDDCRHFMGEVAAAIGLRLPDFSTLRSPSAYVASLWQVNQ